MPGRKRAAYDASFKLKVVKYAEECNNNRLTARHFEVDEKQVRQWRKTADQLATLPKTKKANRGRKAQFIREEQQLKEWVLSLRQSGFIVTRGAIRVKAKEIIQDPVFKASANWCTRFMRRNNLTIRQRTKISQKLPEELEEKIESFQRFIIQKRMDYDYPLSLIGNMDETPVFFDLPSNRTVDEVGAKTVNVRTTGHEKTHFTTVLACMADGTKLPPMVIFKRKTMPKESFPPGVVVHVHEKGWMDEGGMLLWLEKCWGRRPGGSTSPRSLLVWDQFRAHLTDRVKLRTKNGHNTDVAVIPGGLTSILQPLDVSVNHPFKSHLRGQWSAWMASGAPQRTAAGNLKRPPLPTVVQWVKNAWDSIDAKIIQKSFKKCCISNNMDGTEDDCLWNDKDDEDMDVSDDETYDDVLTDAQMCKLLQDDSDDDEDFRGFE